MTMQGPLTQWVTDHRKHHALSDRRATRIRRTWGTGRGRGVRGQGFAHAHVGWPSRSRVSSAAAPTARIYEDRLVRTIDRLYLFWVVLTLGIPFLIGYLVFDGSVAKGVEAMVWGGLLRIFLYQHAMPCRTRSATCSGARTTVPWTRRGTTGSSLCSSSARAGYNNHHAFPSSARHGLHRWQVDVSCRVIRGLERLGLVWNVRRPTGDQLERRRVPQPGHGEPATAEAQGRGCGLCRRPARSSSAATRSAQRLARGSGIGGPMSAERDPVQGSRNHAVAPLDSQGLSTLEAAPEFAGETPGIPGR